MVISVCRAVININGALVNLLFRFATNNSRDVALFHRKRPLALHIDGCEAIRRDQHSICTTRRYCDRNNRARSALLVINVNIPLRVIELDRVVIVTSLTGSQRHSLALPVEPLPRRDQFDPSAERNQNVIRLEYLNLRESANSLLSHQITRGLDRSEHVSS